MSARLVLSERFAAKGASEDDVNKALEQIWTSQEFRNELSKAGLESAVARTANPFLTEATGEQFGVVETIIIGVAVGVGTHLGKKVVDELWLLMKRELTRRFGARLEPIPDERPSKGGNS